MKCMVVLCGLLAVASANPGGLISYQYANPAGVTYRGTGLAPALPIGVAQPVAAPAAVAAEPVAAAPAPVQYAAPAPVQYAAPAPAPVQYAAPAPVQYAAHAAPAHLVQQHVGYVNQQVVSQVPGVAQVPVTKLALTQGVTQKLVDVAQPAVKNRRVKVRRPALRKEFYDIEHRIVVRPAGSATLELSQPISKEQKGPAVITPTAYQQIAPVVRYGTARQIIDGPGVSQLAAQQVALARGALPAGPAPQGFARSAQGQQEQQQQQQQQEPQTRQSQPEQPQFPPQQPPQQPEQPQFPPQQPPQQQEQPQQPPQQPPQQEQQSPFPQFRSAGIPRRPLQLRPQGAPQPQGPPQQAPQGRASDDAIEIDANSQQQQQQQPFGQQEQFQQQQQQFQQQQQQFQQQQQQQQPFGQQQQQQGPQQQQQPQGPQGQAGPQGRSNGLTFNPDMPAELQGRLLEFLSAKGGSVTEVLNENGSPANSASVLQVADALQDVNLQGGERITTRRIVVTRPIETVQEVDIQEPATKIHRLAVNTPTLFKQAVQGVANVPVQKTVVQNVATPFLKTSITPAYAHAAAPAYAYA